MSTDDRNRPPEDEPVVIGSGLDDVEVSLREGLRRDADAIQPHDRLDAILAEAHGGDLRPAAGNPVPAHWQRWLLPVAVAALVALVAVGIWVVRQPGPTPPPAASPTTTPTTQTRTSGTTTTSPSPGPVATTQSLPVYYAGPRTDGSRSLVLFREFVPTSVPAPGNVGDKTTAALRQAVRGAPADTTYRPMWQGVEVDTVSVSSTTIQVRLTTGAKGLDPASGRIAVQQLVWTAQAAVGKGNVPVRFTLADGGTALAGDLTTGQTYTRPTDDMAVWAILSPVWISEPSRGQTLKAGAVTVSGVASTFEANVQWRVLQGSKTVVSGHTTATVAAPQRGTYTFTTGSLAAGDYTVQVFETSPKDGSVSASATMPFTLK